MVDGVGKLNILILRKIGGGWGAGARGKLNKNVSKKMKLVTESIHLGKWGNSPVLPRAKFIRI